MPPHLDLKLLSVFIAVAETGSFTGAAHKLNATQSTVSHKIARLEQNLGRLLVRRTTRSTRLTEDGEVLLGHARRIEAVAGDITAHFNKPSIRGEVRLSVPEDFVDAGFVDVLAEFKRLQPGVKILLRVGLAQEQRKWLEAGELDLAVIRSIDPATAGRALWSESIIWVARDDLAARLADGDMEILPLVHVPAPCLYREVAMAALATRNIRWTTVMTCPHLEGIRAAVRAGLGAAAVVESAAPQDCLPLGHAHGLPDLPSCNLLLVQAGKRPTSEAISALKQVISEYGRRACAPSPGTVLPG